MAKLSEFVAGQIRDIFENVYVGGAFVISAEKLLFMYNQDRLTKGIWRDLHERWVRLAEDLGEDIPPELLVGHDKESHMVCFAYGREFDQATKDWHAEPFLANIQDRLEGKAEEE